MKLFSRHEKVLLVALTIYSFIPAFGGLLRVLELAVGPAVGLPENQRAQAAPMTITVHILSSAVFCLVGALQFVPSLRPTGAHRAIGHTVAASGCLSATTGLWMTHFFSFPAELQGSLLYGVRIIMGLSMLGLISRSVITIRSHSYLQHGASMLRAYAIGQGASTQTFVGIGWIVITGIEAQGLLRDGLMVFSWAFNLLAAEWLIRTFLRRGAHGNSARSISTVIPRNS